MVDDTVQQSVQDSPQPSALSSPSATPVSPTDQSPPPTDIGQIPPNWPSEKDATSSAQVQTPSHEPEQSTVANTDSSSQDSPASETIEETPPVVLNPTVESKEETQTQNTSAEIGQVVEKQTEPISPIPAQSTVQAGEEIHPEPVKPEPPSQILANPSLDQPVVSEPTVEKPPESPVQQVDTHVDLPDNQAAQVQPVPSDSASKEVIEQKNDELANFKPEPLQPSQDAPLANTDFGKNTQESFGDILTGQIQPSSNLPTSPVSSPVSGPIPESPPSQQKSVSFGDLMKDIEIIPPVIPEAERPVEKQQPAPISQPQPQLSPQISPISTQSPSLSQLDVDTKLKEEQDKRRILANQARAQKKSDNLQKVMDYVKIKQTVSNEDVQKLLRVSQSTATNYLAQLTKKGLLKREGIRGGATYHL